MQLSVPTSLRRPITTGVPTALLQVDLQSRLWPSIQLPFMLTRELLIWLQPHLSPLQPCVIMALRLALSWNPLSPLPPSLAAVGLWVDLAHTGRASSNQACASRPQGAAQTCLPGFFHTKHVSQGSNRSDEMGVQRSHSTLGCPHGTISKQKLLPTGAGP